MCALIAMSPLIDHERATQARHFDLIGTEQENGINLARTRRGDDLARSLASPPGKRTDLQTAHPRGCRMEHREAIPAVFDGPNAQGKSRREA